MNKHLGVKSLLAILFIFILMSLFSSCKLQKSRNPISTNQISSPSDLDPGLSQLYLLFSKNETDHSIVVITSLDKKHQNTIEIDRMIEDVSLSPDSSFFVYSAVEKIENEKRSGIWIYEILNNNEMKIAGYPETIFTVLLETPIITYDEKQVLYTATWFNKEELNLVASDIYGDHHIIISSNQNLISQPVISQDGKKILYLCGGIDKDSREPGFQICIMNSDNTDRQVLTYDGDYHGSYLFTPENQKIVYTEWETGGLLKILQKPTRKLFSINIDGSNRKRIIDFEGVIKAISPDGQDIILEGRPNENYPYSIYIVDINGDNLRHLTYFDEFLANWYPEEEN
jgi:Tol biopolymer transport system component